MGLGFALGTKHKKDGWGSDIIINIAGAGSAKVSFGVFS